jgi:hypothetical protein
MMTGVLMLAVALSVPVFAENSADDVAQLKRRVAALETQLQEISKLVEPLKAQQAADTRRKTLREKFEKKMAQDRSKYSQEKLRDAENLYQVANQKWGTPEANESLQTMIKKYPDINRTGCAVLYVAQKSKANERASYLRECINKYNDCFYGDGVQVGAYARFLLAEDYRSAGNAEKAEALYSELRANYADAVDHGGKLLIDTIGADRK